MVDMYSLVNYEGSSIFPEALPQNMTEMFCFEVLIISSGCFVPYLNTHLFILESSAKLVLSLLEIFPSGAPSTTFRFKYT